MKRSLAWPVAVGYFLLSLLVTDFRSVFEFDPDEGYNLIKALLLDQGYQFSSEIWSDQPPLFAYLLWGCLEWSGWTVAGARTLVLAFSALLLFALCDTTFVIARRSVNSARANGALVVTATFLLLASGFSELRVSVMIGLPSIAMAALAMRVALRAGDEADPPARRTRFIAAAGVLLGLSLSIKLFTAFLVPVVLATALAPELTRRLRGQPVAPRRPAFIFLAALTATLLLGFSPTLRSGLFTDLVAPHVGALQAEHLSHLALWQLLERDQVPYFAALMGAAVAVRMRWWTALPWLAWLLLGLAALSVHHPLWAHHNQLLVAPAAVLAGLALAGLPVVLRRPAETGIFFAAGVFLITTLSLTSGYRGWDLLKPQWRDESGKREAMAAIFALRVPPGPIVSAEQIYAFYLRRAVPPGLAVTSSKRFRSGNLDGDAIINIIEQERVPLVIVSRRWPAAVRQQVRAALAASYQSVWKSESIRELEVFARQPTR